MKRIYIFSRWAAAGYGWKGKARRENNKHDNSPAKFRTFACSSRLCSSESPVIGTQPEPVRRGTS